MTHHTDIHGDVPRLTVKERVLFGKHASHAVLRETRFDRNYLPLDAAPDDWGRSERFPSGWWLLPAAFLGGCGWVGLAMLVL